MNEVDLIKKEPKRYFYCNLCKDRNIEAFGCITVVPKEVAKPDSCQYYKETEEDSPVWVETNYTILEEE